LREKKGIVYLRNTHYGGVSGRHVSNRDEYRENRGSRKIVIFLDKALSVPNPSWLKPSLVSPFNHYRKVYFLAKSKNSYDFICVVAKIIT